MTRNTRRRFLEVTSVSIATMLAGCGGSDGGEEETGDTEMLVGADGNNRFEPEELEIDSGTTVEFVWDSGGHNLQVWDQPDESEWSRSMEIHDEGDVETHTFDIEGEYEVYCSHHGGPSGDMHATILVGDGE